MPAKTGKVLELVALRTWHSLCNHSFGDGAETMTLGVLTTVAKREDPPEGEGPPKSKFRYKQGTLVLREGRRYQLSIEPQTARESMKRFLYEIMDNKLWKQSYHPTNTAICLYRYS